jgi:hypothetical protein
MPPPLPFPCLMSKCEKKRDHIMTGHGIPGSIATTTSDRNSCGHRRRHEPMDVPRRERCFAIGQWCLMLFCFIVRPNGAFLPAFLMCNTNYLSKTLE